MSIPDEVGDDWEGVDGGVESRSAMDDVSKAMDNASERRKVKISEKKRRGVNGCNINARRS